MRVRPDRRALPVLRIAGDNRIRQMSETIARVAERVDDFGLIATPDMSMRDIISHCGTVGDAGELNIVLSEGPWTFKDGYVIDRPNVHFWGQAGNTVFERHRLDADVTARSGAILSLEASNISVSGIMFNESKSVSYPAVKILGPRCVVSRCFFEDCYQAVVVNGSAATGVRVSDNYVKAARNSTTAILVESSAAHGVISGNVVESSHTKDIKLDAGTLRFAIVGNQTFNGTIEYTAANGHSAAGNPGTVTAL